MVREADPDGISYVYRYDGEKWEKIQAIDVTLVNEVDNRLSAQLAGKTKMIDHSYSTLGQRRKGKRPIFSFISDDAPIQDYTILKPIIEEKNIPVGIAVITSTINTSGNLSWQQLKELESLGCEVMSHTHQHRDSRTLSEEVL